jgi:predicted enzyme related to lactoylglutathione lyase
MIKTAWLTIGTDHFTKVVEFYRLVLQQDPKPFSPDRYAEFHLPGLRLGIFSPQADHQQEFAHSEQSGFSLCLEVENLEMAIAQFQRGNLKLHSCEIQTASHGREIYVYDPAGNRLILHESFGS